jgi:hypothetical protein
MTDILRTLSDRELLLHQRITAFTGTMAAKQEQLRSSGIIEDYKQLHRKHLALLQASPDKQERLELLKRLIFLNWYYLVEPSIYSGLEELDEDSIQTAYGILETWMNHNDSLDQEFLWMLSYYSSWDYAILLYSENCLPTLTAFVKAAGHSSSSLPRQPQRSLHNRGLMGRYWRSVLGANYLG